MFSVFSISAYLDSKMLISAGSEAQWSNLVPIKLSIFFVERESSDQSYHRETFL